MLVDCSTLFLRQNLSLVEKVKALENGRVCASLSLSFFPTILLWRYFQSINEALTSDKGDGTV